MVETSLEDDLAALLSKYNRTAYELCANEGSNKDPDRAPLCKLSSFLTELPCLIKTKEQATEELAHSLVSIAVDGVAPFPYIHNQAQEALLKICANQSDFAFFAIKALEESFLKIRKSYPLANNRDLLNKARSSNRYARQRGINLFNAFIEEKAEAITSEVVKEFVLSELEPLAHHAHILNDPSAVASSLIAGTISYQPMVPQTTGAKKSPVLITDTRIAAITMVFGDTMDTFELLLTKRPDFDDLILGLLEESKLPDDPDSKAFTSSVIKYLKETVKEARSPSVDRANLTTNRGGSEYPSC